ncbi:hypothetical protein J2W57_000167 [Chryseobacterium ginsenosidimutans]|uniref:Uncharacterized protein n=1 Tax=Chryseobacterium geocarposphaerae TaxID=1416776 RepID=A0ABU1L971_9FLAO|nr:hypothetical protein [Chryseobacterium geocarposphaerae]MDR6696818.1 hypothetical protein [Chryseobacterium ginsenosidimutans]
MNLSKFKNIFLVFGIIYLIDGISTLICHDCPVYSFFGYPITKTQELFRQFITGSILIFAYWTQRNK